MGNNKKIGQVKLEEAMKFERVTEIAKRLGTSRQTLYNLKTGHFRSETISIGLCRSLKNELNIDYEDWFEDVI